MEAQPPGGQEPPSEKPEEPEEPKAEQPPAPPPPPPPSGGGWQPPGGPAGSQPPPPPPSGGYTPPPPPAYAPPPPPPGAYQPPPPGYAPPGSVAASPPTDQMAIWSIILAGVGLPGLCCFGVGGIILGAVAFFLGGSSIHRIQASNGGVGGLTLAQIGRWGGLAVAILGLLILAFYVIAIANGSLSNSTTP
jgi:hypothetical protein